MNCWFRWVVLLSLPVWATAAQKPQEDLEGKVKRLERQVKELTEMVTALQNHLAGHRKGGSRPDQRKMPPTGPASGEAQPAADPNGLSLSWDNGLLMKRTETDRGVEKTPFKVKLGGRLMNDWTFFLGDAVLSVPDGSSGTRSASFRDGTQFRRARLGMEAEIHNLVFKAEYDFAGGDADFKDVYLGLKKLPVFGRLQVGHFKEPFGLETLTSSKYITFMERSLPNLFAPDRNNGIMSTRQAMFVDDAKKKGRLQYAIGFFHDSNDSGNGNNGNGGYNVTGRLTGLPWYRSGDQLLHLGVAYSHRSHQEGTLGLRQRLGANLAPRIIDARIPVRSENLLGLEAAFKKGRFSLQSEYMTSFIESPSLSDPRLDGYYVQGSLFLTKNHRPYKNSAGVFDRVTPSSPFIGKERGLGAWEVAARFSRLDLSDQGFNGGEVDGFTLGLNWYLAPNTRFMWNYVFGDADPGGEVNVLQTRFQVDF